MSKDIEGSAQQHSGQATSTVAQAIAPATGSPAPTNVVTDSEQDAPRSDLAGTPEDDQQWDEAVAVSRSKTTSAPEVLDMKSFAQSKGSGNISEKLRVEETKAQLAAAREGMEREAARAAAEKERKEQEARGKETAKAPTAGGTGGIWVSARMRAAQSASLPKVRIGGAAKQQQLDTSNEELFPDLAAADKILEQKEKSTPGVRIPKKTPVGGGASWASKTSVKRPAKPPMKSVAPVEQTTEAVAKKEAVLDEASKSKPIVDEPEPTPQPDVDQAQSDNPDPAPVEAPEAESPAPMPAVKPKKSGKKKKKDLSSFKPGS